MVQHLSCIEHDTVTGSLVSACKTAVGHTLTGESAVIAVADPLVLTHHVADLSAAYAEVACGNVGVGSDVSVKLSHKGLAEAHDLHVGLAVGIEVSAALAAADGQTGQSILEDLLKAEELNDTDIYIGSKSETALVRTKRTVELNAEAAVDLDLAVVVHPRNSEHDLSLRLGDSLDESHLLVLGVRIKNRLQGSQNLGSSLKELGLIRIFCCQLFQLFANV